MKDNSKSKVYQCFHPQLWRVCLATWCLKMVPIPVGIISAKLLSRIVASATAGHFSTVLMFGILLILITILIKLFEVGTGIAYDKATTQALQRCKLLLYRSFFSCPLSKLYKTQIGDSVEKLNDDFKTVTEKMLNLKPSVWIGFFTASIYFGYLGLKNIWISIILLGISLIQIIPPWIIKRFLQANYDDCRKIEAEETNYIVSGYLGFTTIKTYQLRDWWLGGYDQINKRYMKIGNRATVTENAEWSLNTLFKSILKYGTYGMVGWFVLKDICSVETATEVIALSASFFASVNTVLSSVSSFAVARTAEKRLSEWFVEMEKSENASSETLICFESVSLTLGEKNLFLNSNCMINPQKINIIKGENGIGKSTLLHLITGLIRPDNGIISIGGVDAGLFSASSSPLMMFFLPQEDMALGITANELYEMVLGINRPDAEEIAIRFGLTEAILDNTLITNLSGGERKKVFLSLAFALQPQILLLDEPTNSLDDASKKLLSQLLVERSGGAVIIIHDSVLDSIGQEFFRIKDGSVYHETY